MLQTEINQYSACHSPKSTANLSGFVMTVLRYYGRNLKSPTLPQRKKQTVYIPSTEEMQSIVDYIREHKPKYFVPIMLAFMGLRRSEICALNLSDLADDDVLTIDKAMVQNEAKQWVVKQQTKTVDSTRTLLLPHDLAELIRKQKFIYNGHPELIYRTLTETQDILNIPHFPLHKCRHFFASYLHNEGYSDKQIQEMGGWKSNSVLQTVYQHAMEIDEAKRKVADTMGKLYKL